MLKSDAPVVTWRSPILSLSSPCHRVVGGGFPSMEPGRKSVGAPFCPLVVGENILQSGPQDRVAPCPVPQDSTTAHS